MRGVANAPAETRMMGIVHDALRRDIDRALDALSTSPAPAGVRRVLIGEHVTWMMGFLRFHHDGEDVALWPIVRARVPGGAALLDSLEADHLRVAPLIDRCAKAAGDYISGSSDAQRMALLDALRDLREELFPHLRREEEELMPLVSVSITDQQLREVHDQYFVKTKSLAQLGFEGHWLLDGLEPDRAQVVLHQVPTLPRFVLVHTFGRRYRRRAMACWGPPDAVHGATSHKAYGPAAPSRRVIPRAGGAEVVVGAAIDAVWRIVSDVTRVGEWSHECRRVEWLDGATKPAPGVRFRGTNKAGPWTWSRVNEILVAEEPRRFMWRTVPTLAFPDSSEWRIDLEAVDGGTRVVQSYRVLRAPAVLTRLYPFLVPAHRDRTTGLTEDLRRLGELAQDRDAAARATISGMQSTW
jgi:Hemerythrin HHE cation binding domain/Polyketide cyclase / dehydrase and lipid transport